MTWPRWGFCWVAPYNGLWEFTASVPQLSSPLPPSKSWGPLELWTTSCNHPHMWRWHLASPTMAHVIRTSFKQIYLAPGQRGNFLYAGGGQMGWSEVGVNEPLTESYHLERFWHAEVAVAAYTSASSSSCPASRLNSCEGSVCRSVEWQRSSQWKL